MAGTAALVTATSVTKVAAPAGAPVSSTREDAGDATAFYLDYHCLCCLRAAEPS